MEVELDVRKSTGLILTVALVSVILIALALLGRAVTPFDEAEVPGILTPARWKAYALARQARTEAVVLVKDLKALQTLVKQEHPDPVEAMLTAQRIYAHHRRGTSATGAARSAVIRAAERVALWASGAVSRNEAIKSVNEAVQAVEPLVEQYELEER